MQVPTDNGSEHYDLAHNDQNTELTVSGAICPTQESTVFVEVRRGMTILTSEGDEAGKVAAVIVDKHEKRVTHILLSRPSNRPEYRLVPLVLIVQVHEEQVRLCIFSQVVNTLPIWHKL